ncbi:type I-E CRISPR-associated protein Cas5/CasD [Leptothrix sp. BB-4]
MARHLVLVLDAPLVAFGGETIDNLGVIRDFPALSMITGLFANALGWDRSEAARHERLQARLTIGSLLRRPGRPLRDFQTAQLDGDDRGWTTHGVPEERAGGAGTYLGPHLRYRDFHADRITQVVVRLDPADEAPTLDDIAAALDRPQRPLFIGRKPCIPARRLVDRWVEADDVLAALRQLVDDEPLSGGLQAQWPDGEGRLSGDRASDLGDERRWRTGLHGGWRPVRSGVIHADLPGLRA